MGEENQDYERGNMGYSGRIDYPNNGRSMYDMGNSYAMPYYEAPQRQERSWLLTPKWGYSGSSKEEMVEHLTQMMQDTDDPKFKKAISDCITSINK